MRPLPMTLEETGVDLNASEAHNPWRPAGRSCYPQEMPRQSQWCALCFSRPPEEGWEARCRLGVEGIDKKWKGRQELTRRATGENCCRGPNFRPHDSSQQGGCKRRLLCLTVFPDSSLYWSGCEGLETLAKHHTPHQATWGTAKRRGWAACGPAGRVLGCFRRTEVGLVADRRLCCVNVPQPPSLYEPTEPRASGRIHVAYRDLNSDRRS